MAELSTDSGVGMPLALDRATPPARADLVRNGAELVALSERFYGRIFAGAIAFSGLAALAALALLPMRTTGPLDRVTPAVVIAGLIVVATPLALRHAAALYRLLRRRPRLELVLVAGAAALIVYPLKSELWWPSCALLMLLATIVPLRRVLAYCLVVLLANLAAHLIADDLSETAPVAIIGLWIGYPFWTAAFALGTDRLAAFVMALNTTTAARRPPPRRARAWTADDPVAFAPPAVGDPPTTAGAPGEDGAFMPPRSTQRLTARQLQVVALLADGLRYGEVADCLSISVRQVERHVVHAIGRLGVRNARELVVVAIAEGLVPRSAAA